MNKLYFKALDYGATDFGLSNRKNKRFYVLYNGKYIHFGSKSGSTFIDNNDELKRKNWRARHSKIKNKKGQFVYLIPESPEYWSWHLLW